VGTIRLDEASAWHMGYPRSLDRGCVRYTERLMERGEPGLLKNLLIYCTTRNWICYLIKLFLLENIIVEMGERGICKSFEFKITENKMQILCA
jgi:hypothetical protein